MSTKKLIGPAALAGALLAASLSGQAQAADELVVYGSAPAVVGRVEQASRATVEEYIREFNRELRTTIEEQMKRELAPKVELAMVAAPKRG